MYLARAKGPGAIWSLTLSKPREIAANAVEPHRHAVAISNGINVKTERQFEGPNPFSANVLML
jgi:hypothetical protein